MYNSKTLVQSTPTIIIQTKFLIQVSKEERDNDAQTQANGFTMVRNWEHKNTNN